MALDLSRRHLYVASLQKAGGHYSILRIPVDVTASRQSGYKETNSTFLPALVSPPGGLALDLRFGSRWAYWTQPGDDGAADGKLLRASLDNTYANGEARVIEDLSLTIGRKYLHDPEGLALDLQVSKPSVPTRKIYNARVQF